LTSLLAVVEGVTLVVTTLEEHAPGVPRVEGRHPWPLGFATGSSLQYVTAPDDSDCVDDVVVVAQPVNSRAKSPAIVSRLVRLCCIRTPTLNEADTGAMSPHHALLLGLFIV